MVSDTKILLVDDLKENLLALEGLLKAPSLQIFKAQSGIEALELLLQHEFALAIIDVQMPQMNGIEVAELMRGAERTKSVPIMFVTAGVRDRYWLFKGYENGAVDFLYKPLEPYVVRSKVKVFIELDQRKKMLEVQIVKLKETEARMREALRLRDDFLSIASHELKTPLSSLVLHTQMAKSRLSKGDFAADRVDRFVDHVDRQAGRLARLIDEMLDVTRISSGKLALQRERCDLAQLTRETVEHLSPLIKQSGSEISLELCEGGIGEWDTLRLEQVFTNLITNALRYGEGRPVHIKMWRESANLVSWSIQDQGRGIAEADLERIFNRFERAVSPQKSPGLGLGLYIVSQILERHGAKIAVNSTLGQGSTFTVSLPCFKEEKINSSITVAI